ncbi:hypothetical protein JCM5350_001247 [Sporobolomyces pararoseus]
MSRDIKEDSSNFSSLSSNELLSTSKQPRITLESLPNELISAIVLRLGSFILPPLSTRLLPFHRSQLYRSVILDLRHYELFKRTLDSNKALRAFVEILTLRFASRQNSSRPDNVPAVTKESLVESLPKLRSLTMTIDETGMRFFTPSTGNFQKCQRLEKHLVQSHWVFLEKKRLGSASRQKCDVFDWNILAGLGGDEGDKLGFSNGGTVDELGKVIKLERSTEDTYKISYFSQNLPTIESEHLRGIPLSRLDFVFLNQTYSSLNSIFRALSQPPLLTHLSIFIGLELSSEIDHSDLRIATLFPNLTHLSLGGYALPASNAFYDSLSFLPLGYLHLGPRSRVRIQPLIDILPDKNGSKPSLSKLKSLRLDNIYSKAPNQMEEDPGDLFSWCRPEWTVECPRAKVEDLKELAEKLGIETNGITFDSLSTEDTYLLELEGQQQQRQEATRAVLAEHLVRVELQALAGESDTESESD